MRLLAIQTAQGPHPMTRAEAIERAWDAYAKHDSVHNGLASAYDAGMIAGLQLAVKVLDNLAKGKNTRAEELEAKKDSEAAYAVFYGASALRTAACAIRAEIQLRKGAKGK